MPLFSILALFFLFTSFYITMQEDRQETRTATVSSHRTETEMWTLEQNELYVTFVDAKSKTNINFLVMVPMSFINFLGSWKAETNSLNSIESKWKCRNVENVLLFIWQVCWNQAHWSCSMYFTISLLLPEAAQKDCLLQSNKQYLALAAIKDTEVINFQ